LLCDCRSPSRLLPLLLLPLLLWLVVSPDGGDLLHHVSRGVQVDEALVDPEGRQEAQQYHSKVVRW
jgi:hypothetical protein